MRLARACRLGRRESKRIRFSCFMYYFYFCLWHTHTLVRVTHALNIAAGYTHARHTYTILYAGNTQIIFRASARNKLIFKHLAARAVLAPHSGLKKTCSFFALVLSLALSRLLGLSRFLPRASQSRRDRTRGNVI